MPGYLLDTNIIINWYDASKSDHEAVMDHMAAIDSQSILCMSAISWGEMEYGHRLVSEANMPEQLARNAFFEYELPFCIDIRQSTSIYYGQIRARLFNKYAPNKLKTKGLRPEQLVDPATALQLGIQENDIWLAAQAFEHNLIFATCDKKFDNRLSAVTSRAGASKWVRN